MVVCLTGICTGAPPAVTPLTIQTAHEFDDGKAAGTLMLPAAAPIVKLIWLLFATVPVGAPAGAGPTQLALLPLSTR
jgi:hypothetical protein